jgi:hypothetical protein
LFDVELRENKVTDFCDLSPKNVPVKSTWTRNKSNVNVPFLILSDLKRSGKIGDNPPVRTISRMPFEHLQENTCSLQPAVLGM